MIVDMVYKMTHIVTHFGKVHALVFKSQVIPVVKVCFRPWIRSPLKSAMINQTVNSLQPLCLTTPDPLEPLT